MAKRRGFDLPKLSRRPTHERLPWPGLKAKDRFTRFIAEKVKEKKEAAEIELWAKEQITRLFEYLNSDVVFALVVREILSKRPKGPKLPSITAWCRNVRGPRRKTQRQSECRAHKGAPISEQGRPMILRNLMSTSVSHATAAQGEAIYRARYQSKFERTYPGRFVAINVRTQEALVTESAEDAVRQALRQDASGIFHLVRVGHVSAFGAGLYMECAALELPPGLLIA